MTGWIAVGVMLLGAFLLGFFVCAFFADNAYERGVREGFREANGNRSEW